LHDFSLVFFMRRPQLPLIYDSYPEAISNLTLKVHMYIQIKRSFDYISSSQIRSNMCSFGGEGLTKYLRLPQPPPHPQEPSIEHICNLPECMLASLYA
jgi:hypothetical protein